MDDVTKAALVAVLPLMWVGSHSAIERGVGFIALLLVGCFSQHLANSLRKYRDSLTQED